MGRTKAEQQPIFSMTEGDALAKALPSTGQTEEKLLDVMAAMMKFHLSLLAMLQGVGASGNFRKTSEKLTRAIGKDYNSLFTIARLSRDTVRVSLGANSSPAPAN